MKILIISYHYFPVLNPRAFRWSEVSSELVNQGHKVHVLAHKAKNSSSFEKINGVRIYRTGKSMPDYKKSNDNSKHTVNVKKGLLIIFKSKVLNLLFLIIKTIYDFTWKKLFWPDSNFLWYFSGLRESKKLVRKYNYDKIITVSHPFTCHLIGLRLKNKYPNLFWLADSGDPFCFVRLTKINNTKLYSNLNYFIERKVFEKANILSFTTQGTIDKYSEIFPSVYSKFNLIPPLVKLSDSYPYNINKQNKNKIIFSFFGQLYKNLRTPDGLLYMLQSLINSDNKFKEIIELHFYGDHTPCLDSFNNYKSLEDNIVFHGMLNKEKVLLAMSKSDILINIGNNTAYQLPSKIVEYVAFSKPIINIISIDNDSSKIYLKDFSFVFNYKIKDDIGNIQNFIQNLYKIEIDNSNVQNFTNLHSSKVITNQYLKALGNKKIIHNCILN
jgi:hypothetical protein